MACRTTGNCEHAYRKPGKNTVHCMIQMEKKSKWDFCAHQYFCSQSQRYELSVEANDCPVSQSNC